MTETSEPAGDWRPKFDVVQRLGEARKRNLFTDVNFTVGEGESIKSFSAHRNVLAFSSPVFEAMFFGTVAEKKNNIAIVDIDPDAFDAMLRFCYGEKLSFTNVTFAAKTHLVADKYLVSDLQTITNDYISKATMDDPQFWEIIHQDKFFLIPIVKKKCLDYITQNAASLFKSYLFTSVSYNVVEAILLTDKISISEYELLLALIRWGIGSIQSEKKLKNKLESLLPHVRFACLTVDEFCNFLDCHPGLLDADDSLAIMKHLHKSTVYKLPLWCSQSSKKRN